MLHDPNTYAQFLLLILPLLFVSKSDTGMGLLGWVTALVLSGSFLFAIYLSGSRGAVLGLAVLAGLFLIRRLRTTGAVLTSILGGSVLLAVNAYSTRTISISGGMDRLS